MASETARHSRGRREVDRRALLGALLGVAASSGLSRAQSPSPPGKIGYLHPVTIAPDHNTLVLLSAAWRKLGYDQGNNVLLRSAGGDLSRLPRLVTDLIDQRVGVIIAVGASAVRAASQATRTLPIVAIDLETDPVRAGYAASVSRPGGNITGLFMDLPSLAGKWIELLRETAPAIRRIVLIWDSTTSRDQLEAATAAARAVGLDVSVVEARASNEYDDVFARLQKEEPTGLVQLTAPGTAPTFSRAAASAIAHGLPLITFLKANVQNGALLCYGPAVDSYFPRAAILADKILKGAKPGDLPIERPAKFELIVNLRTAKALGLAISPALLARADDVIE